MKDSLRQQFDRLGFRLAELDALLADGSIAADMKRYRALTKEQAEVSGLVERYRRYQAHEADLAAARGREVTALDTLIAGAVAGGIATFATHPPDVLRTRAQLGGTVSLAKLVAEVRVCVGAQERAHAVCVSAQHGSGEWRRVAIVPRMHISPGREQELHRSLVALG